MAHFLSSIYIYPDPVIYSNWENIIKKLISISVQINDLDIVYKNTPNNLNDIYKNNLYKLNKVNLDFVLFEYYKPTKKEKISLTTELFNKPSEPIVSYIKSNFNNYLNILLDYEEEHSDTVETIKYILNRNELTDEQKLQYLNGSKTILDNFDSIDENLWETILQNNAIKYDTENIITYFAKKELDDTLIRFINNSIPSIIANYSIKTEEDRNEYLFLRDIIISKGVINDKLKNILSSMNYHDDIFNCPNLNTEKIKMFIENHFITMTVENLIFIRENYQDSLYLFIEVNISIYQEIMNDDIFELTELLYILDRNTIADEIKLSLLGFTKDVITIKDNYTSKILFHILENNLDINDLPELYKRYDVYDLNIQDKIYELAITHIYDITTNRQKLSYQLLIKLLSSPNLETSYKEDLLFNNYNLLNIDEIKESLQNLRLTYLQNLFIGKKTTYTISNKDGTLELLSKLSDYGLILEYKMCENGKYGITKE